MKILKFEQFLTEALKDEIQKHHIDLLKNIHGDIKTDKYLDMDVPQKTPNIKEGKWSISKEEKDSIIKLIFDDIDIKPTIEELKFCKKYYTKKFIEIFNKAKVDKSIDFNIPNNPIELSIYLSKLHNNNFNTINVKETLSSEKILRDKNGVPIKDENGVFKKIFKEKGEVVFNKNKSNFSTFVELFNNVFFEDIPNPLSFSNLNYFYIRTKNIARMDLFDNFDMELYITSKPVDILNMSISNFYHSCMNLYDGDAKTQVLPNIFDINMKVAYLIFNTPFTDKKGNVNPITSVVRCIIRNIKGKLFCDQIYPNLDIGNDKLTKMFKNIVTKYTGMKFDYKDEVYYYTSPNKDLEEPYMDTLNGVRVINNVKTKSLSSVYGFHEEDVEKSDEDNIYYVHSKDKTRRFYVAPFDEDKFTKKKWDIVKNISKIDYKKLNEIISKYFNFKLFGKLDGIEGNESDINRRVVEIIKDDYIGDTLSFINENRECLSKNMDRESFILLYCIGNKCVSINGINIYEVEDY